MDKSHKTPLWHIVFIGIGIFSIVALVLNLFVLSQPAKHDLYFQSQNSWGQADLLRTLSHLTNTPIVTGGNIEILNNGDEFFPILFEDIENANESINFSAYIWKEGFVSDKMFSLLTAKASEGVAVRLIVDGFGGKTASDESIEKLREAGGKVEIYHPFRFGQFTKFHKRNHARTIIIDDAVGYTGGMAVADYWLGDARNKDEWRDMMFRMTGPALTHLSKSFMGQWEISSGEILIPKTEDVFDGGLAESVSLTSFSPDEDAQQLSTFFALSVAAAKESVLIETPYMVLEKQLEKTLIEAAKRGIDIKIVLPGKIIDSKFVQTASQHYYKPLLESGVEIYEYNGAMMHSKVMLVDDSWSVIGSANIDTRSTFFNVENIIGIKDTDFATRLSEVIEEDIRNSTLITLESWKKRSVFRKIFEPVVFIFDKQL